MLRLHDYVLSSECYTVRLMLALLAISYEKIAVQTYPRLATAPGGDVPVLEDGATVLRDPGEILQHLARSHDLSKRWLPVGAEAAISAWLAFAKTDLATLSEARRIALFGNGDGVGPLNRQGRAALRHLDDRLADRAVAGGAWLVGDGPTIADIAVFPAAMLSHDSGIGHEDCPAINLWQRRLRKLPGFIGMPGIPDYF